MSGAWTEDLRDASFRGIAFEVNSLGHQAGQQRVVHNYPLRRLPGFEDLGERDGVLSVQGFLIGKDALAQRDALLDALRQPGAGRLVLPWTSPVQAITISLPRFTYRLDEGDIVPFSCEFLPASKAEQPQQSQNTRANLQQQTADTREAVSEQFKDQFSTDNQPEFVRDAARLQISDQLKALDDARKLSGVVLDARAEFDLAVFNLAESTELNDAAEVAAGIEAVFTTFTSTLQQPLDAVKVLRPLWSLPTTLDAVFGSTPQRQAQRINQQAMAVQWATQALTATGDAIARGQFASHNEAITLRNDLLDAMDPLLDAADDTTRPQLADLFAALASDLAARSESLGRVVEFVPAHTMPCVFVSQLLYGTGAAGDEIFRRNQAVIDHPGFARGGVPLEVLIHD